MVLQRRKIRDGDERGWLIFVGKKGPVVGGVMKKCLFIAEAEEGESVSVI